MRENVHRMMHEFQRVNHFPSSTELTRKDRMWDNFHRMATSESAFSLALDLK